MKIKIPYKQLINWYRLNKRSFYWKSESSSNFNKFIVEILLQQTNAKKVNDFYKYFFNKIRNFQDINNINLKELSYMLKPLGLNNQKAQNLKKLSSIILNNFAGEVPIDKDSLLSLPGVGEYIANATICFIHKKRAPALDVNIARIISRYYKLNIKNNNYMSDKNILTIAEQNLPKKNYIEYNYALIDLGAIICTYRKPKCSECPIKGNCLY